MEKEFLLAKMTWPEVAERLEVCDIAIVPIGSTEQHGPALPVDNDHYIATQISHSVAELIWEDVKVTVAPTIAYGFSPHHMDFKGTISLRESTLASLIVDVCVSLVVHGFRNIILINGHGGNNTGISNALHQLKAKVDAKIFSINWWDMAADKIREVAKRPVFHACDMETSVAWSLGQRVLEEKRVDEPGRSLYPGFIEADMLASPPHVSTSFDMKEVTDSGVVGFSTKATKEKGQLISEVVLDRIVEFIRQLA
ncbi:MAG: creatininase family protein [Candidatus Thorarchaeota archaeon]|jgi:creatinine amidohydrolase